ncbi:DUF5789 family protein [Halalkalirubrum salinum]|uniref:DUF5789 family protein n=1 Tax=Halalkalirubrum salinum TaxID=2563889 RepID=UPI0010FB43C8|nr:DUF5789 family protein [Halalkalirubrum salinum]
MSDEDAEDEPAVELGTGPSVEGAPLARVASRLTWPATKSAIVEQEGDSEIRTPDGATELSTVLESIDTTYFDRRQTFIDEVTAVVGTGPVLTDE